MKFKQFYLGCLAHASYYIGSKRAAAVVASDREIFNKKTGYDFSEF